MVQTVSGAAPNIDASALTRRDELLIAQGDVDPRGIVNGLSNNGVPDGYKRTDAIAVKGKDGRVYAVPIERTPRGGIIATDAAGKSTSFVGELKQAGNTTYNALSATRVADQIAGKADFRLPGLPLASAGTEPGTLIVSFEVAKPNLLDKTIKQYGENSTQVAFLRTFLDGPPAYTQLWPGVGLGRAAEAGIAQVGEPYELGVASSLRDTLKLAAGDSQNPLSIPAKAALPQTEAWIADIKQRAGAKGINLAIADNPRAAGALFDPVTQRLYEEGRGMGLQVAADLVDLVPSGAFKGLSGESRLGRTVRSFEESAPSNARRAAAGELVDIAANPIANASRQRIALPASRQAELFARDFGAKGALGESLSTRLAEYERVRGAGAIERLRSSPAQLYGGGARDVGQLGEASLDAARISAADRPAYRRVLADVREGVAREGNVNGQAPRERLLSIYNDLANPNSTVSKQVAERVSQLRLAEAVASPVGRQGLPIRQQADLLMQFHGVDAKLADTVRPRIEAWAQGKGANAIESLRTSPGVLYGSGDRSIGLVGEAALDRLRIPAAERGAYRQVMADVRNTLARDGKPDSVPRLNAVYRELVEPGSATARTVAERVQALKAAQQVERARTGSVGNGVVFDAAGQPQKIFATAGTGQGIPVQVNGKQMVAELRSAKAADGQSYLGWGTNERFYPLDKRVMTADGKVDPTQLQQRIVDDLNAGNARSDALVPRAEWDARHPPKAATPTEPTVTGGGQPPNKPPRPPVATGGTPPDKPDPNKPGDPIQPEVVPPEAPIVGATTPRKPGVSYQTKVSIDIKPKIGPIGAQVAKVDVKADVKDVMAAISEWRKRGGDAETTVTVGADGRVSVDTGRIDRVKDLLEALGKKGEVSISLGNLRPQIGKDLTGAARNDKIGFDVSDALDKRLFVQKGAAGTPAPGALGGEAEGLQQLLPQRMRDNLMTLSRSELNVEKLPGLNTYRYMGDPIEITVKKEISVGSKQLDEALAKIPGGQAAADLLPTLDLKAVVTWKLKLQTGDLLDKGVVDALNAQRLQPGSNTANLKGGQWSHQNTTTFDMGEVPFFGKGQGVGGVRPSNTLVPLGEINQGTLDVSTSTGAGLPLAAKANIEGILRQDPKAMANANLVERTVGNLLRKSLEAAGFAPTVKAAGGQALPPELAGLKPSNWFVRDEANRIGGRGEFRATQLPNGKTGWEGIAPLPDAANPAGTSLLTLRRGDSRVDLALPTRVYELLGTSRKVSNADVQALRDWAAAQGRDASEVQRFVQTLQNGKALDLGQQQRLLDLLAGNEGTPRVGPR